MLINQRAIQKKPRLTHHQLCVAALYSIYYLFTGDLVLQPELTDCLDQVLLAGIWERAAFSCRRSSNASGSGLKPTSH